MIDIALVTTCLILALIPWSLAFANLRAYRPPPLIAASGADGVAVSVLIPARNEERAIAAAVESVLASRDVVLEVIVLDDHSEDGTARAVAELSRRDPRVRLATAPPLPAGWCGKQHACQNLAQLARYPLLCFIDADVRLAPAALARIAAFVQQSGASLVSGFPRQDTGSFLEGLLLPFMHFLLLAYLPIERMRRDVKPAFGAGCGQVFMADRAAYLRAGGHAAIASSLHDGLALPKAFRRAGLKTDLCDIAGLARCRMYFNSRDVWRGLTKNAVEGMAAPTRIVPFTVLLAGGHVLPVVLLVLGLAGYLSTLSTALAALATALKLLAASSDGTALSPSVL